MNAANAFSQYRARLSTPDDFPSWRDQARAFLAAGVEPEQLIWDVSDDAAPDLFAEQGLSLAEPTGQRSVVVPRELLSLLRLALLHREASRFALAYRLLWRTGSNPHLPNDPSDPDVIALRKFAKAVRRDIHKMHAFVRFRKVGEVAGREQYAAWFEPDHHIVRSTAGFFRDRFAGMDWLIVTPEASIGWDGESLRHGPGGCREDVPEEDAVEEEWRAYYASIFNPARLKVAAMKREMPVRYWRNLPEAQLISALVQRAEGRVDSMIADRKDEPSFFDADSANDAATERHFDSLQAVYQALRDEDVPPSAAFSNHIVAGEGPAGAPIMFIGEQPGDQEDLLDRPFVGPAGQLLDHCMEEAGIARGESFMTNAVKRFKYEPRGKRRMHQTPNAGDIAHYRWWLAEEIRLVAPRIIVSLGASALHSLTGRKQSLGPVRGTMMDWDGRMLLPTVHPSFLLRLPDEQGRAIERDKFVRDLKKAAQAAKG